MSEPTPSSSLKVFGAMFLFALIFALGCLVLLGTIVGPAYLGYILGGWVGAAVGAVIGVCLAFAEIATFLILGMSSKTPESSRQPAP